jgi:hypothetical protein
VETEDPGGRLSDAELRELARLLARFVTHDLEQSEDWRIQTAYGPVYVSITNELLPGWYDKMFTTMWPLPPRLAGDRAKGFTVWRQDDNSNQYVVSRHETHAEAESVAADMGRAATSSSTGSQHLNEPGLPSLPGGEVRQGVRAFSRCRLWTGQETPRVG